MSSSEAQIEAPSIVSNAPELPFAEALPHSSGNLAPMRWRRGGHSEELAICDECQSNELDVSYNRRSHGFRLHVVSLDTIIQFNLPLNFNNKYCLDRDVSHFADYLPKSRLPLVQGSFWSLIAREPRLRNLAETLYQMGRPLIGDVIQMTPQELVGDASATPKELELLSGILASADLRLGMKVAGWGSFRRGQFR